MAARSSLLNIFCASKRINPNSPFYSSVATEKSFHGSLLPHLEIVVLCRTTYFLLSHLLQWFIWTSNPAIFHWLISDGRQYFYPSWSIPLLLTPGTLPTQAGDFIYTLLIMWQYPIVPSLSPNSTATSDVGSPNWCLYVQILCTLISLILLLCPLSGTVGHVKVVGHYTCPSFMVG